MALSDRIAVMHNGQVQQIGTPTEIYDRPTSLFVAQFIGKANLLNGMVTKSEADVTWVQLGEVEIRAIAPSSLPSVGSTVTVMIRPERIQLNPTHPTDNQIGGKLAGTTYVGQLLEVQVDTAIAPLRVVQLSGQAIGGDTLTLGWNVTDCVVIPAP
jgi:ABC-type Fe3+/spermidine/putrescine transport system ATPase subunit